MKKVNTPEVNTIVLDLNTVTEIMATAILDDDKSTLTEVKASAVNSVMAAEALFKQTESAEIKKAMFRLNTLRQLEKSNNSMDAIISGKRNKAKRFASKCVKALAA